MSAASLLFPFFEVGIDSIANPHDTLAVVWNERTTSYTIHYHVWDIYGNATDINGNVTLSSFESWSISMRTLISAAASSTKTQPHALLLTLTKDMMSLVIPRRTRQ